MFLVLFHNWLLPEVRMRFCKILTIKGSGLFAVPVQLLNYLRIPLIIADLRRFVLMPDYF